MVWWAGEGFEDDAITEAGRGHDRRELRRHPLSILQHQFEGVLPGSRWGIDVDRGGGVQDHVDTSCGCRRMLSGQALMLLASFRPDIVSRLPMWILRGLACSAIGIRNRSTPAV